MIWTLRAKVLPLCVVEKNGVFPLGRKTNGYSRAAIGKTIFLIETPFHFDIIINVSTGNPFAG
jgi:hypothetical protein